MSRARTGRGFLLVVACVVGMPGTPTAASEARAYVPVRVFASSTQTNAAGVPVPEHAPEMAVDGDLETRWSSDYSDPQWICFDLGKPRVFNTVTILWETAHARAYELQVSDDGQRWKAVFWTGHGDGGEDCVYVGNQKARYVRVYGRKRATRWGYSIYDGRVEWRDGVRAPEPPTGLRVRSAEDSVVLTWDESRGDVSGWNVYRSTEATGRYYRINRGVVTTPGYADRTTTNGTGYLYAVTAVRELGNESQPSEVVSARPRPAAPARLVGRTADGLAIYEGASKGNFGRFGWLTYPWFKTVFSIPWYEPGAARDGTLSYVLEKDYSINRWPRDFFLVGRGAPSKARVSDCNWVSKTVDLTFSNFSYQLTYGLTTPGILIRTSDRRLSLRSPGWQNAAFLLRGEPVVRARQLLYDTSADGPLSENWILVWHDKTDVPALVVLQKRPTRMSMVDGALDIDFDGPLGAAVLAMPYGVDISEKKLTKDLALTPRALETCRFWSRALLAYPVKCREDFWIDEKQQRVGIRDRYEYVTIKDAWGTRPLPLAPVPPLVAFAAEHEYPAEILSEIGDYGFPTWYGPLKGAVGKGEVEYSLPIPPLQHRALVNMPGGEKYKRQMNQLVDTGLKYWCGGSLWADVPDPIWENSPTARGNIDLNTWIGPLPSTIMAMSFLDEPLKARVRQALRDRVCVPLLSYPDRIPIERRVEPYTGQDYMVNYWGTAYGDAQYGDADEVAACVLQSFYYYALYTGDWDTMRRGWGTLRGLAHYLEVLNDWAYLASGCREYGMLSAVDMLNATYPGLLAYAKLARGVGDDGTYRKALYMAARAAIPAVIRWRLEDYAVKYGLCREGQIIAGFSEQGLVVYDFPTSHGWNDTGMIYLDSASGGVYPEQLNLYLSYARDEFAAWQQRVDREYPGWVRDGHGLYDVYALALLGEPKEKLLGYLDTTVPAAIEKFRLDKAGLFVPHTIATALTVDCPLRLTDSWAPARFVDAFYDPRQETARLTFDAGGLEGLRLEAFCERVPSAVVALPDGKPLRRVGNPGDARAAPGTWSYDPGDRVLHIHAAASGKVRLAVRFGPGDADGDSFAD